MLYAFWNLHSDKPAPATVLRFGRGEPIRGLRVIPSEVPVNFVYGGIPFAVMNALQRFSGQQPPAA